jgi:hypothetical protein
MIERIDGLPDDVIGFRVSGHLDREDYTETLSPAVEAAIERGKVRILLEIPSFDGMAPGALWEDLKMGVHDLRAWERIALLTDVEWMRRATALFGWMTPGELRVFAGGERDAAVAWLAS